MKKKNIIQKYICPDILINGSFKWKLVVLKDLKQQTKDLDVLNLIEEHMISLSKIYKYFLLCYIDEFKEAINKYEIFRNVNSGLKMLFYGGLKMSFFSGLSLSHA